MFKRLFLTGLVASLASLTTLTVVAREHKLDASVQAAPQAAGTLLDGKAFDVSQSKDKVRVVQFWATWCPTCVKEMPAVQAWYDANKSKGLELVSVSIDDSKKEVSDWLAKNPGYGTQPFAWQGDVKHNFGKVKGTPTFLVVGKDGSVVKSYVGGIKQADLDEISKML